MVIPGKTLNPSMIEAADTPISLVDARYRYSLVNDCFCRILTRQRKEIIGRRIDEIWAGNAYAALITPGLNKCFAGQAGQIESWIDLPALGRRYCRIIFSPCGEENEGTKQAIVVTCDITDTENRDAVMRRGQQVRAYQEHLKSLVEERTEELRASEEKFRNIFLNATEGIFQIMPGGRILSANPAFAHIHGFDSPRQLVTEVSSIVTLHVNHKRREEYVRILAEQGRVRNFECNVYRRDGQAIWVSVNTITVRDETGKMLYYEGTVQDITERKRMEEQLLIQRDLALELGHISSLDAALRLCLEMALRASGANCGVVHVRNRETDDLELAAHFGLKKPLPAHFSHIEAGSRTWLLSTERRKVGFSRGEDTREPVRSYLLEEGINTLAIVPVLYDGRLIASMNLGFYQLPAPNPGAATLELIAGQLGNIMVRIGTQRALVRDIEKRKKVEDALQAKSRSLQEINTALKVLLDQRELDKAELKELVVGNVRKLILPYVRKLRESREEEVQYSLIDTIEGNLNAIVSPFLKRIRVFNFTPKELEVITLIKEGKTTKEIAAILRVTIAAVELHRHNIRKKLNLNGIRKNLHSYLLSLE